MQQYKRWCEVLTVILSSLSSILTPSFFHDMVGSGWPRGGWHSRTAGSPAATITSAGFCLKSSRRTTRNGKEKIVLVKYCGKNQLWYNYFHKRREKNQLLILFSMLYTVQYIGFFLTPILKRISADVLHAMQTTLKEIQPSCHSGT